MDYRLKSLLDGMAILRLMKMAKNIRKTMKKGIVEKITIGDIRLRDSRNKKIDLLFIKKDADTHLHFFDKDDSLEMVTTLQVSPNRNKKEHVDVNTDNFFNVLGEEIFNFINNLHKLDIPIENYENIKTSTYFPKILDWKSKKNGKEVVIDIDYCEIISKLSELSLNEDRVGIINEGSDARLIIIKDGRILSCEMDALDQICSKIEPILATDKFTGKRMI